MASLKVRVRAASGGPTLRVQVPLPCTLRALKNVIASQTSQAASSFSVSLNKRDPIDGPSSALLSAFGVINGDLLFYVPSNAVSGHLSSNAAPASFEASRNLSSHSTPTSLSSVEETQETLGNRTSTASERRLSSSSEEQRRSVDPMILRRELCAAAALQRTHISQSTISSTEDQSSPSDIPDESPRLSTDNSNPASTSYGKEPINQSAKGKPKVDYSMDASGSEAMEIEGEESEVPESPSPEKSLSSIPDILQRVLLVELPKVKEKQAILVLAVHAVMLETGFVLQQPWGVVGSSQGCGLPAGWSGKGGLVSLTYTLPEIIRAATSGQQSPVGDAILRCQIVGNALVVYGAVTGGGGSEVYRVSLPVLRYLHKDLVVEDSGNAGDALKVMTNLSESRKPDATPTDCQPTEEHAMFENTMNMFCNTFELWQQVKDNLSLPLLTCMCEKAGLQPPASLLMLPTELKIKVLEFLPAAALATMCCVCSELKFLAASDEFWKVRFKEEFGWLDSDRAPGGRGWRCAFTREWARRRRREDERREAGRQLRAQAFPTLIMRPPPLSPHFPGGMGGIGGIGGIGGDYDRFPGLGGGIGGFRPRGPGGAFWTAGFSGPLAETGRLMLGPHRPGGRFELGGLQGEMELRPPMNLNGGGIDDDDENLDLLPASVLENDLGRDLVAHPPDEL